MSNSSGGFDFDKAFEPERPPQLSVPAEITGSASELRRVKTGSSSLGPCRRGQGLSVTALVLAAACASAIGVGVYRGIAAIHLSMNPFDNFSSWMTLVTISVCGAIVAMAAGIVAAVRARPRTLAALAITASVVLPAIGLIIGTKFGIDAMASQLAAEAARLGLTVTQALEETLSENDIDTNPLIDLLFRLLN